ncbi:Hypothetical protein R9X50_00496600 [Acrodontium crateriforme]|uniref:DUF3431 domain containing protein n=1 Tax=Acrodontium crateriforme TaxID=150365 RepID=A0AAQ3M8S1_9PEZI|nr:Hypothetical protein R9X50_00496600 [Acrodontium crateriforme]
MSRWRGVRIAVAALFLVLLALYTRIDFGRHGVNRFFRPVDEKTGDKPQQEGPMRSIQNEQSTGADAYTRKHDMTRIESRTGPLDYETPLAATTQTQWNAVPGTETTTGVATASMAAADLTKIVVMGATSIEDTSWVAAELIDWQHAIYRVDLVENATESTILHTDVNKGREAMPYLTYIIDNYDHLPDVMAFIHPHRKGYPAAWHNDAPGYDSVLMLQQLRLDTIARRGYVNLRCLWEPGCPQEVRPWREPPDIERVQEHAFPYYYSLFFNKTLDETRKLVEVVATPCCAQFAVSREQVRERSKEDYQKYQQILKVTKYDDDVSGRVMEYMWHIIFGQDAVFCPDRNQCWCDVFGRC